MLQTFRALGNTKFIKIFLGILALSFVTWGIGDYITGRSGTTALTVNDTPIDAVTIERSYRNQVAEVQQKLGKGLSDQLIGLMNLPGQTLQQAIQENILLNTADNLGLAASPAAVRQQVTTNPAFVIDGKFDFATYQQQLSRVGFTATGYEQELANAKKIQQLASLMVPPTLPQPMQIALAKQQQTLLSVGVATLAPTKVTKQPTTEELVSFYEAHLDRYTSPETRDVNVVTLDQEQIYNNLQPTQTAIADYFASHQERYNRPSQRFVAHIVLEDEATAQTIFEELQQGADFAQLAQQYSVDNFSANNGGELGWVSQQDLPDSFAAKTFAAELNALTGPVESPLGWHILTVTQERAASTPTLAEVQEQVLADLKITQAEDQFYTLQDELDDALAANESLAQVASRLGLKVQELGMVTMDMADATSTQYDPEIIAAAFAASGQTTEIAELSESKLAYVAVKSILPAAPQPLAAVKKQVAQDWTSTYQQQAMQNQATKMLTAAQENGNLRQAASAAKWQELSNIGRQQGAPEWMSNTLLSTLFRSPVGTILPQAIPYKGQLVLVQLTNRKVPEKVDLTQFTPKLQASLSQELQHQWLTNLMNRADVELNHTILRQIFGDNWQG